MARIRIINDLVKYIMDNNIDVNKEIVIGAEGYNTYKKDANIEDKELNVQILPTGELFISDDCDYEEITVTTEEFGFEVTETRRRYVKVTAKDYDTALEMINSAVNNDILDLDDNSYIEDSEVNDYENLDNCDDVTSEVE